jgi:hypothetical protein
MGEGVADGGRSPAGYDHESFLAAEQLLVQRPPPGPRLRSRYHRQARGAGGEVVIEQRQPERFKLADEFLLSPVQGDAQLFRALVQGLGDHR